MGNDAYRYMDWLPTVPLLLIELIMVMSLDEATTNDMCLKLGSAAALMIILGYPGEITMDHGTRWVFWFLAMLPFVFIVYILPMLGLDTGSGALVGIQIGYSISDFISKCGLGLMVTKIAMAKTKQAKDGSTERLIGDGGMTLQTAGGFTN